MSFNVEDRLTASYTFGQRVADSVARFGGSWTFIISFILMMAIWMLINVLHPFGWNFWPYPFILLNLALSTIAAIQAPLIMMSQTGQQIMIACKREMTLTSIWSRKEKFAYCIRRLIIWCSKTRQIYWKFKVANRIVGVVSNQVAQLRQEMNQEKWRRWRRCRQI